MKLTVKGKTLFNKAQTGTQLQFTKVAIGDGILSEGQTLESLTELINKTKDLNINNSNINDDGTAEIITALSNQGLAEGMYIREIGLYANDPDDGEILYSVANASDKADYLPPEGTDVIEELIKIVTIIGNTENIDVIINESMVYVTQTSFNEFKTQVNASMADIAYKTVGGTANAITVSKAGFTLTDGQYVEFKATANNTGNMTIKVNGEAVKSLRNEDGQQLSNGDIEANKYYKAIYNSNNDFFLLAPRGRGKIVFDDVVPISSGDTWVYKTNMPTHRSGATSSVVNDKIYVIGGYTGNRTVVNEEYNPLTNTWSTKANMPTARDGLTSSVVNDKIYAIGGWGNNNTNVNEMYDSSTNTWSIKANMPTSRSNMTSSVVNNKIYVINGHKNEEYTPTSNTWSVKTTMPTNRNYITSSVVNDKIYVIGGWSNYSSIRTNEEYSPSTNRWISKANMPTARSHLTSSAINDKIYVIGGSDSDQTALSTNEEYNPSTNSWSTKASMSTARKHLTSSVVNDKIYVIGGSNHNDNRYNTNEEYTPISNTLGYINKNNKLLLDKDASVNVQFIPANTKTKVTSEGHIKVKSNTPTTGYIQL
jgi:N-acetylneuraminic acid mutarotase